MAGRDPPPLQFRRRLEAAAPTVTTSAATNGFRQNIGPFMLSGSSARTKAAGAHRPLPCEASSRFRVR